MRSLLYTKAVNSPKLHDELRAALGPIYDSFSTYNLDIEIRVTDEPNPGTDNLVTSIVNTHDSAPKPTPIRNWAQTYVANLSLFLRLNKAFDEAVQATTADVPASLTAACASVLAVLYSAPNPVIAWFRKYRALMGVAAAANDPLDPATLTDAQRRQLLSLIRDFAANGLATVATFASLQE